MKIIELWIWSHVSPTSGKRVRTRYLLTAENAQAQLVDPERIEGTRELRRVPEGPSENHMTGAFINKPK